MHAPPNQAEADIIHMHLCFAYRLHFHIWGYTQVLDSGLAITWCSLSLFFCVWVMQTSFISENNDVSQSTFLTSSCVMARITANKQIHLSIVCVCVCACQGVVEMKAVMNVWEKVVKSYGRWLRIDVSNKKNEDENGESSL